jgi:hypothetical protein
MSQYIRTIFQFIGRTLNEFVSTERNKMSNKVDKGVANSVQENVSFTDLRDEAQILNRVPKKFSFNESLQTFVNIFTSGDNPDADISQDKYNISATNPNGVNYNMNASEFRNIIGRSDGATNQSISGFVGAKNTFTEGEDIPFPLKTGGNFLGFNLTPPLRDITEKTVSQGFRNPAIVSKARTNYNDEYQGTGTASETVGLDFKFVNEASGLRCFVRQNNGPSSSNLVNRNKLGGLLGTGVHDYKFTKDRYPYASQYTDSTPTDSNKIQMTSGTYVPFYFLPKLTNGVDTLRLKSISEVRTSNGNAKSHNSSVTRGEGVSTAITTLHSPTSVTVPTPSSSNNDSGATFIGIDTQQTGMGLGDSFGFTQKMTASTNNKRGINHRRVFQMQLQASKNNVSRGQERTILNYFFGLETHIDIYDVGAPISTISYTIDFSGIDITGGDVFGWVASMEFSFGYGYSGYSDSRLKDNIKFVHRPHGHNVYTWDWNKLAKSIGADKQPNYGVLADELVSTNPEALEKDENGYWKVNYFKLRQNK